VKFKYYLRGCGFGILLAVIVLVVALHNRGGVMTDEKVIARAQELGMVMPGDTEEGVTETEQPAATELDEKPESETGAAQQTGAENLSEKSAGTASEISSERASENTGTSSEAQKPETDGTSDTDGTIEIEVSNGDACRQVAEKLYDNGLVDDAEEFRLFMANKGYDNQIYVGTYQFQRGMTYDEIAETLIKKP
jgi:hypothetical protein